MSSLVFIGLILIPLSTVDAGWLTTPEFKVIRGTTIISSGSTSETITEGVDYNLESGVTINNTFIRITNSRFTGMGSTSGGTQTTNLFTVRIDNPENLLTSITFTRIGTTNNDRIDWEIIQYIGDSGGDNEFIVRDIGDLSTSAFVVNGSSISSISDSNKVVVYITGQATGSSTAGFWHSGLFTSDLLSDNGNFVPELTRGDDSATGYVSYAVVEYTGSNWRDIQRVEFQNDATAWTVTVPDVNGTYTLSTALLDSSKTFLHPQFRNENDGVSQGLDDCGENVGLTDSTTELTIWRRITTGEAAKYNVVWIVENTHSGGGAMSVEHISYYDSDVTAPEEKFYNITVTAVEYLDGTSIMGETCSADGGGTAYPRGSANVRLYNTTNVFWAVSDSGQEEWRTIDVVQWPRNPLPLGDPNDDSILAYFFLDSPANDPPVFIDWFETTEAQTPDEDVLVHAEIYDVDNTSGQLTVYMFYSTDDFLTHNISAPMTFNNSNGLHYYTFTVLVAGQPSGTYYQYYFTAFDGTTRVREPSTVGTYLEFQWYYPGGDNPGGGLETTTVPVPEEPAPEVVGYLFRDLVLGISVVMFMFLFILLIWKRDYVKEKIKRPVISVGFSKLSVSTNGLKGTLGKSKPMRILPTEKPSRFSLNKTKVGSSLKIMEEKILDSKSLKELKKESTKKGSVSILSRGSGKIKTLEIIKVDTQKSSFGFLGKESKGKTSSFMKSEGKGKSMSFMGNLGSDKAMKEIKKQSKRKKGFNIKF